MKKYEDTKYLRDHMKGTNRSRLKSSLKDEEPVKVPKKIKEKIRK